MTVTQLLLVIGAANLNDAHAALILRQADKVAAAHVKAARGAFMDLNNAHHRDAIDRIARAVCGADLDEEKATLESAEALLPRDHESVVDAACNLHNPVIEAAYAFGLALGLRIAGGAR